MLDRYDKMILKDTIDESNESKSIDFKKTH